jgi:hypothetical protein
MLRTGLTGLQGVESILYLGCGSREGALVECSECGIQLCIAPRELSAQARLDRTVSSLQGLGFRVWGLGICRRRIPGSKKESDATVDWAGGSLILSKRIDFKDDGLEEGQTIPPTSTLALSRRLQGRDPWLQHP